MAHVRQYRPFSGRGFQVKVLPTFQGVPFPLRSGLRIDNAYRFSPSGDGPKKSAFMRAVITPTCTTITTTCTMMKPPSSSPDQASDQADAAAGREVHALPCPAMPCHALPLITWNPIPETRNPKPGSRRVCASARRVAHWFLRNETRNPEPGT